MEAENNLGGLLGKSSRLLANRFNSDLVTLGLTVEQWSLLALLWDTDHQTQKMLQVALLKDKASITSLLHYLIQNAFVTKIQNPEDKRSFIVSLTPKGKEIKTQSIPLAMQNIGYAIEGIDADALETTIETLKQIIQNLTKEKPYEKCTYHPITPKRAESNH